MPSRAYAYFAPAVNVEPQRAQIVLPVFALAVPIFAGASSILREAPIGNDYHFSFKLPINSFGENFIAAIRWMDDDIYVRFVLFAHADAILNYPLYNGEKIGLNAVIEIWSVDSVGTPELDENYVFDTSRLILPFAETGACGGCGCVNNSESVTLTFIEPSVLPPGAECNPFCGDLCNTEPPMPDCDCPTIVKETVEAARDYNPDVFVDPATLTTLGGLVAGDGLSKLFRWDAASLAIDIGDETTTVIRPSSIDALAPGRWIQMSV